MPFCTNSKAIIEMPKCGTQIWATTMRRTMIKAVYLRITDVQWQRHFAVSSNFGVYPLPMAEPVTELKERTWISAKSVMVLETCCSRLMAIPILSFSQV